VKRQAGVRWLGLSSPPCPSPRRLRIDVTNGKGPQPWGPLYPKDVPPANPAAGPSVLKSHAWVLATS
jgi:hypothetical protein